MWWSRDPPGPAPALPPSLIGRRAARGPQRLARAEVGGGSHGRARMASHGRGPGAPDPATVTRHHLSPSRSRLPRPRVRTPAHPIVRLVQYGTRIPPPAPTHNYQGLDIPCHSCFFFCQQGPQPTSSWSPYSASTGPYPTLPHLAHAPCLTDRHSASPHNSATHLSLLGYQSTSVRT